MSFGGFQVSFNAYTGQGEGPQDVTTTAAVANAMIVYENTYHDSRYRNTLNGVAAWVSSHYSGIKGQRVAESFCHRCRLLR